MRLVPKNGLNLVTDDVLSLFKLLPKEAFCLTGWQYTSPDRVPERMISGLGGVWSQFKTPGLQLNWLTTARSSLQSDAPSETNAW
jgi:hypothetical protein